MKKLNLDLICDVELDDINTNDYPDFCDAYIVNATWSHTRKSLTDNELDDLNENYGEFVYDAVISQLF